MTRIEQNKYKNLILYLAQELGGEIRGKKKLAKLLYFVDFDFYEKFQQSITGDEYKALPMGPFPEKMDDAVSNLVKEKLMTVESKQEYTDYNPTEVYKTINAPDLSVFKPEEIKMIDRVISKYGHLSGKQLEDLSHAEAPYIGTDLNASIAYELTFYRGTDFSEYA
ncbi:MAG: Panacea domain-containing protein [Patescibacteria group bacterium]